MDFGTKLLVVANLILAGGAVINVFYLHRQMGISNKQMREAWQQAVESQHNLYRPMLLIPQDTAIASMYGQLDYGKYSQLVRCRNVGSGVATNIRGCVYGYIAKDLHRENVVCFEFAAQEPLPKEAEKVYDAVGKVVLLSQEETIGDYGLAAPEGMIARFTLTYHDIFDNKHAAIFDLSRDDRWISRGFPKIDKDLADLERERTEALARTNQAVLDAAVQHRHIEAQG